MKPLVLQMTADETRRQDPC